jgi:hypothetical protein
MAIFKTMYYSNVNWLVFPFEQAYDVPSIFVHLERERERERKFKNSYKITEFS